MFSRMAMKVEKPLVLLLTMKEDNPRFILTVTVEIPRRLMPTMGNWGVTPATIHQSMMSKPAMLLTMIKVDKSRLPTTIEVMKVEKPSLLKMKKLMMMTSQNRNLFSFVTGSEEDEVLGKPDQTQLTRNKLLDVAGEPQPLQPRTSPRRYPRHSQPPKPPTPDNTSTST
jgi:hypothetical protein